MYIDTITIIYIEGIFACLLLMWVIVLLSITRRPGMLGRRLKRLFCIRVGEDQE